MSCNYQGTYINTRSNILNGNSNFDISISPQTCAHYIINYIRLNASYYVKSSLTVFKNRSYSSFVFFKQLPIEMSSQVKRL